MAGWSRPPSAPARSAARSTATRSAAGGTPRPAPAAPHGSRRSDTAGPSLLLIRGLRDGLPAETARLALHGGAGVEGTDLAAGDRNPVERFVGETRVDLELHDVASF